MTKHVTNEILDQISEAFNNNDLDAMLSHFHEDGVFVNAVGPAETGDVYAGKEQIREFFSNLFANMNSISWNINHPNIISDCGKYTTTQWNRIGVDKDGNRTEWLGCDIYEFKDGLVVKKDTYIKVVN